MSLSVHIEGEGLSPKLKVRLGFESRIEVENELSLVVPFLLASHKTDPPKIKARLRSKSQA